MLVERGLHPVDPRRPSLVQIRPISVARVRNVSKVGAQNGRSPASPTNHPENVTCSSVRSQRQLARKSSKRVQTGEAIPGVPIPSVVQTAVRSCRHSDGYQGFGLKIRNGDW
jgi:hypothetical protein